MPYNTTPLPPRAEPTGTTQLPLSRVKKIIAQDPDINICSNNAAFVLTVAAEMFVQHLAKAAHDAVKADPKPRKNIQYKDIANAVAAKDDLEFLEDVVPKTVTYKSIKDQAAKTRARLNGETAGNGKNGTTITNGKKGSKANGRASNASLLDFKNVAINQDEEEREKVGEDDENTTAGGNEREEDPDAQLQQEARKAAGDEDVDMS